MDPGDVAALETTLPPAKTWRWRDGKVKPSLVSLLAAVEDGFVEEAWLPPHPPALVLPPPQRGSWPVMSRIDYVLSAVLLAGLYLSGGGVPEAPAELQV